MLQLNLQECKNALIFLNRVQLEGKESMAHAEVCIKIQGIANELSKPPAPPAPPPELPPVAPPTVPGPTGDKPDPDKGKH